MVHLRETLKPKTLLYSFISFLSRVLFPAPEGPLSTTGLGPAIAEGEKQKQEFSKETRVAEDARLPLHAPVALTD